MLKRLLFRMAKSPMMGRIVGNTFRYCAWAIPIKKVYSSREVLAFEHPLPAYNHHVILSPKGAVRNLQQMASGGHRESFAAIWQAVKALHASYSEYRNAFVLVANGGRRQEVQQVHFHLFTDHSMVNEFVAPAQAENILHRDQDICVMKHPDPDWELHFVLQPGNGACLPAYFGGILQSIGCLDAEFDITQRGYSLVYQSHQLLDWERPIFHIVSGKKLK